MPCRRLRSGWRLGGGVELEEELAEHCEARRSELPRPCGLDVGDGFADNGDGTDTSRGQRDALGAEGVGIGPTFEIAEPFEPSEEGVESLLADPKTVRQFGRPRSLWSGVVEDREVRGVEVVEPGCVQAVEHVLLHGLPRGTEEGADERRPERLLLRTALCKGT